MEKIVDLKAPITEITAINSNNLGKVGASSEFGGLIKFYIPLNWVSCHN